VTVTSGDEDGRAAAVAWLRFLDAAGVDLALEAEPRPWWTPDADASAPPPPPLPPPPSSPERGPTDARPAPAADETAAPVMPRPAARTGLSAAPAGPVADARRLASEAQSIEELIARLRGFDGCGLARTAMNLCVGDGDPASPLMLVGEAPGAEEDRQHER